jgi:predicted acyltransferase
LKTDELKNPRLVALDFFRGLTIAAMILVNNPGNYKEEYAQLGHAEWHGITLTDFIFPFFIFMVGISTTLSLSKFVESTAPKGIYKRIVKRTILLILFGLFVNLLIYPSVGAFRIAGVLQRIAIVYLVCSVLFINTTWKGQLLIAIIILVGYWLVLAFVPVPGLGVPSLEPVDNLVSWIDRQFLPGMLYAGNHDPEGILSTIPSLASGITGLLTGYILKHNQNMSGTIKRLLQAGFATLLLGLVWSVVFPINKNLWTSSFVLITSGAGAIFLAICIWVIDVKNWRFGTFPFVVFGSNAITAYMLSFVFLYLVWPPFFGENKGIIQVCWDFFVHLGFSAKFSSLLWAVLYTGFIYIPIYVLYQKKVFLKL